MDNTIESNYTAWSGTYDTDRNLTRDLDRDVVRTLLAGRRFCCVLEIGCGTGKNTRLLATLADRVHALDFSQGMLAQARAKNLGPHVTFTRADITRPWPCAPASADLVTCNLVLEHVEHLAPIFREAARVLTPAGHFLLCELHPFRQYLGGRANFQSPTGPVELPTFTHHLSDFLAAAAQAGLTLDTFNEWWHAEDQAKPPRLASFLFRKP